jgi:sec-independent protein translocase protein TatA
VTATTCSESDFFATSSGLTDRSHRQTGYARHMPFGIGATELIILLLVILIVFGPKRLPEMGRSLGRGMREFKDSISGHDDDDTDRDRGRAGLPSAAESHDVTDVARPRERENDPIA